MYERIINILIIDDNVSSINMLNSTLQSVLPTSNIIIANSGLEGIEKAKSEKVDVILLDVMMPLMDGFETCSIMSNDLSTMNIPIIIITGDTSLEYRLKGLECGALAFLTKPVNSKELVAQIKIAFRIRNSFKRYKDIFDMSSEGICIIDLEGNILEVNDSICKLTGYNDQELLTMNIFDIVKNENIDLQEILKSENPIMNEVEHKHKNGNIFTVETLASSILYKGNPAIQLYSRHISSHHLDTENEKLYALSLLTSTMESTADAIMVSDGKGKIIFHNDKFQDLWNIPESILGNDNDSIKYAMTKLLSDPESFQKKIMSLYCSNDIDFDELKLTNGKIIERYSQPLVINGNRKGRVWNFHDITDKKKAEESLAESEAKYKETSRLLRLLCDTNPDMLWAKNMKQEFIFANKAICDILLNAKDTEEPVGKTNMVFAERERAAHPDNPNWHTFGLLCKDSDKVIIETKKPAHFEETGNVKGNYLVLSVHKAPLIDNGEMVGIVGSGRDMTEHIEMEKKIQEQSIMYEKLLFEMKDLMFGMNKIKNDNAEEINKLEVAFEKSYSSLTNLNAEGAE